MIHYQTLENTPIETLFQTFSEAFSDYPVRFNHTMEDYKNMVKRRGFDGKVSVGAFQEGELVGFVLNGIRDIAGVSTAYDVMTGIVPTSRNQGLSKEMFYLVIQTLAEVGVEQYILEVLQENKKAFDIYQKQGFEVVRSYDVFRLEKELMKPEKTAAEIHFLPEISDKDWTLFQTFWESTPSWQNAIESVTNVPELFACSAATIKGKIIGYGIVEKKSGDVPQLAVAENYRNQGVETQLLAALSEKTESTALSIVNVDSELKKFRSLLEEIGFALTTSQYEMVLKLR